MWSKILSAIIKYGTKAVKWVVKHKDTILKIAKEFGIAFVIEWILEHL